MAENNIAKLLRAWMTAFQELEDATQQVLALRTVDVATGAQLDVIGKLVGQPREGVSDDELYRRRVRARILVNRSTGLISDVLAIADLIVYDDDARYVVDNQGAAAYVLRVEDVATTDDVADLLVAFLRDATAAGVRPILEYSPSAPEDVMRWGTGTWGQKWASARE